MQNSALGLLLLVRVLFNVLSKNAVTYWGKMMIVESNSQPWTYCQKWALKLQKRIPPTLFYFSISISLSCFLKAYWLVLFIQNSKVYQIPPSGPEEASKEHVWIECEERVEEEEEERA